MIAIIVIVVFLGGGLVYWYLAQNPSYAPPPAAYRPAQPAVAPPSAASRPSSRPTSAPPASIATAVTYTDSGFSPATVTVQKGGTVVFKNAASDDLWVGANPHPIHNGYPATGGCIGSTFDSCGKIRPGGSWSFTFTFAGRWGYHNHLNPGEGGTVIVQ